MSAAEEITANSLAAPMIDLASPRALAEAGAPLGAAAFRQRLAAEPRIANRLQTLLAERLAASPEEAKLLATPEPPGPEAALESLPASRRRALSAMLQADARAELETSLALLGAIGAGAELRRTVLCDEVMIWIEALGPKRLRLALAHAALGETFAEGAATAPALETDLSFPEALADDLKRRGAAHVAAWLAALPAALAVRLRLALGGPGSELLDVDPPAWADATLPERAVAALESNLAA